MTTPKKGHIPRKGHIPKKAGFPLAVLLTASNNSFAEHAPGDNRNLHFFDQHFFHIFFHPVIHDPHPLGICQEARP